MDIKRSKNRYLAGVCGGIAEYLGVSPFLMRIMWLILTAITFFIPGIIVYIVLWKTIEEED